MIVIKFSINLVIGYKVKFVVCLVDRKLEHFVEIIVKFSKLISLICISSASSWQRSTNVQTWFNVYFVISVYSNFNPSNFCDFDWSINQSIHNHLFHSRCFGLRSVTLACCCYCCWSLIILEQSLKCCNIVCCLSALSLCRILSEKWCSIFKKVMEERLRLLSTKISSSHWDSRKKSGSIKTSWKIKPILLSHQISHQVCTPCVHL